MKLEVKPPRGFMIDTDNYVKSCGLWHHKGSGTPVTAKSVIAALDEWQATAWERANPSLNDPKPKRKWEIAFTDRAYVQVEAHSFILSSDDIAFHVEGQVLPVFWAQTRNIYHVKELV